MDVDIYVMLATLSWIVHASNLGGLHESELKLELPAFVTSRAAFATPPPQTAHKRGCHNGHLLASLFRRFDTPDYSIAEHSIAEPATMLLLGLTGSIATGKSTVSSLLRQAPYSLPIIDADLIARQVVEPGTAGYNAIVKYFLPSTPDLLLPESQATPKGRPLNRPALGRRVFGSGEQRERDRKVLNGIVHPAVRKEMYKQMIWAYLRGNWAVVLDVPLLFESGWERYCGSIIVVGVSDPAIQIQRLRARDAHLTEEDARNRVMSQGDIREKAERCLRRGEGRGVVVWNDGDRGHLEREVRRVMDDVRGRSPWWWGKLLWVLPPLGLVSGLWSWWNMRMMQLSWEEAKKKEKAKL